MCSILHTILYGVNLPCIVYFWSHYWHLSSTSITFLKYNPPSITCLPYTPSSITCLQYTPLPLQVSSTPPTPPLHVSSTPHTTSITCLQYIPHPFTTCLQYTRSPLNISPVQYFLKLCLGGSFPATLWGLIAIHQLRTTGLGNPRKSFLFNQ